jgi:MIF4G domain
MSLTVAQIYSIRFSPKLSLPKIIQDNIAKLRIAPTTFRPARQSHKQQHYKYRSNVESENWREKKLADYVRRIKENDDPDYGQVLGIFNKITTGTLTKLTDDIITLIKKRDEQFRLRVSTLLFDKAIVQHAFSHIMADCAKKLIEKVPDVNEDIRVQITIFPSLYDLEKTLLFPKTGDENYEEKIVNVFKQKDKRRGYAKFVTQLYVRELVPENTIHSSLVNVIDDIQELAKRERGQMSEENIMHFVDFLFETAKILPLNATKLRTLLKESSSTILNIPKTDVPNITMRARFKLEDILKCVQ